MRAQRFTVSFYLTAMLFIVFDIEIVFLYPLAVQLHALGWFGFGEFAFFVLILARRLRLHLAEGRARVVDRHARSRHGLQSERLLWPTKGPSKFEESMSADELEQHLGLTTLEKAVRWAQTKSMWPDTFGLACCAIEMMSIVSSRYDIARFGMEAFRSSPRQADLLIVSGRVAHKMAAPLRQIYDQMLEPKWVIAMGVCASSGGMFNNYTILQGVDRIVPVDIYVPFCPPRPEALMEGIIRLHEAHLAGIPPAYERRGRRDVSEWRSAPGYVVATRGVRRDDGDDRARAASATRASSRATSSASTCSATSSPPTTSAGAATASRGYIGTATGARHQLPDDAGPADAARSSKPKRFAISYHLLAMRQQPRARAPADVAGGRRERAERRPRVARRRLLRARAVRHDGHRRSTAIRI